MLSLINVAEIHFEEHLTSTCCALILVQEQVLSGFVGLSTTRFPVITDQSCRRSVVHLLSRKIRSSMPAGGNNLYVW